MRHPKKWPIIRHIRYFYWAWKFDRYWQNYKHVFLVPNDGDMQYLDAIWRGEK